MQQLLLRRLPTLLNTVFRRAIPSKVWVTGVATNTAATLKGTRVGKPPATKPKGASKEMTRTVSSTRVVA